MRGGLIGLWTVFLDADWLTITKRVWNQFHFRYDMVCNAMWEKWYNWRGFPLKCLKWTQKTSYFFYKLISLFTFIFSQKSPGNFNIRPDLSSLLLCVNHSSHCQTTTRDVFRIQSYFHPGSFQRLTLILHLSGHASSVQQQYRGGGHINSLSLKYDVTLIFKENS